MFQNIGFTELLLIAIVALVLFGPQKLPEIGRVLGRTIRDFKKGAHALLNDEPEEVAAPKPAAQVKPAPQVSTQGEAASSNAVEAGAPSERAAVAFVSAAPAVVESTVEPSAAAAVESVTPTVAPSASPEVVSSVEAPSVTPTAPARTEAPLASAAAPIAPPSNTRRLPD
ncbi:twin-arginine translocase TatA/TatE family subunit [Paenibacillus sp. LMG 31460]|uniref:Sec-independent protein translocase protein TatA n=1 Tax=Paenibacillus germinis TaxID=2654979 RepID=A0ABX1Z441_9BACL|nr:twin-arginine translocase TatA/TatE family subunit [Paenibacillus germinis]NOU87942.1 twin-arginine translocase TatA/TatE family subunit [Paenibacillus germinis]